MTLPFYIAQGGQDSNLQSVDRRFESHRRRGVFWYGPLASPLLQISSLASEHRGEKNAGPNQWIIPVKITPWLLQIHLSLLNLEQSIFDWVKCKQMA